MRIPKWNNISAKSYQLSTKPFASDPCPQLLWSYRRKMEILSTILSVFDSKMMLLIHLVKSLGIQKQMTLHFITQDKCMSICLAFSISDRLYASFSFQSSYSSSAYTCPEAVFRSHLRVGAHLPAHPTVRAGKGNIPYSKALDTTKPAIELSVN